MIRILIIDDMKTIRQMFRLVEEHQSEMEIVAATADGSTGLEKIAKLQPDIALVDLETPGVQGMDIVRLAVQKSPNTKILLLTSNETKGTFHQALQSRANGYLLKNKLQTDIVRAIRSVLREGCQFSPYVLQQHVEPSLSSAAEASASHSTNASSDEITSLDASSPNPQNGWNLFYRNLRLLLLTLCLIVVSGASSFAILPRMEDPVPSQRVAIVTTQLPGANAQRVESLITDKIETALLEIEQVDSLYSTSQANSSVVVVQLKDTVTEVDPVWARVRDKLSDVEPELPVGTSEIVYEDVEPRAVSKMIALSWTLDTPVNPAILGRLSKELGDRLLALDGTAKVEFFGAFREEISVEIRPHQLAALGLSIPEVAQQIEASDAKVSAGHMRNGSNDLLIEMESELDSLNRIRQIPIRNSITSQFTRLGDVAWVRKTIQNPPSDLAIVSGKPAITLALLADSSQRIDRWSEQVNQILVSVNEQLSPGVELTTLFDQSDYVDSRLNSLFFNLLLGAFFVIASTTLLMGWRSAAIVGLALPLSVLMVFSGMRLFGLPLHQMSVTGLVVAMGLLIDNAIVMVDEVKFALNRGASAAAAVAQSTRTLSIPLLASTLTTVLTFMPIALIPGDAGEFVRALSLSVILALSSSLFLSLTVIPALAGWQHNTRQSINRSPTDRSWWKRGLSSPYLAGKYRLSLDWVLARPRWGILLAIALPACGFLSASTLEEQFFPPAERDQFQIVVELSPQTSLSQTEATVLAARDRILEYPEIRDVHWFVGRSAPTFYYNIQRNRRNSPNYAHGLVQASTHRGNGPLVRALQAELQTAFPAARILVRQLEQGPSTRAPIELRLYGHDLEGLRRIGKELQSLLAQVEGIASTSTTLVDSVPTVAVQLDEEQAQLAGLDYRSVASQLDANLEGAIGGTIFEGTEEIPVRVRLSNRDRGNLDRIASTELLPSAATAAAARSPLSLAALGEMDLVPEFASISRRDSLRVNELNGYIASGVLPSSVLQAFQQQLSDNNFQLPPGYTLEIAGEAAERDRAVNGLMSSVGILLVVMLAVLVLSFGSFRAAGTIALVGLFAVGLGLLSLRLFSYPLGFMAILGIVGLIGVSINDSIVVLSALRNHPQANRGDRKAICETVLRSTRHVLATTLTTVTGFAPLLLAGGDFWPPMAICVACGVMGATLFALYFVPCVHILLLRWNGQSFRLFRKQA